MNKRNYQKELELIIEETKKSKKVQSLLLHSCCAPCSSYPIEYLSEYFEITVFYYNPNIFPEEEYDKRVKEESRLIKDMKTIHSVNLLRGEYKPEDFFDMARGMEEILEGGKRCFACYELRLRETAKEALKGGFDYFTTTLSISPLKNADKLNEIGEKIADEYGIKYLNSDFKKKGGYQRSIQLSKEYDLYRQNYCGCIYSKREVNDSSC